MISGCRSSLVTTQNCFTDASGRRRETVCWIMVCLPSSASNCWARFLRLSGQNRVPRPPARITGWNLGGKPSVDSYFRLRDALARHIRFQKLDLGLRPDPELRNARRNYYRIALSETYWLAIGRLQCAAALSRDQYLCRVLPCRTMECLLGLQ